MRKCWVYCRAWIPHFHSRTTSTLIVVHSLFMRSPMLLMGRNTIKTIFKCFWFLYVRVMCACAWCVHAAYVCACCVHVDHVCMLHVCARAVYMLLVVALPMGCVQPWLRPPAPLSLPHHTKHNRWLYYPTTRCDVIRAQGLVNKRLAAGRLCMAISLFSWWTLTSLLPLKERL